jgi:hypothetical protein
MTERAAANSWREDLLDNPILRREAVPRIIRRASADARAILAAFAFACSLMVGVFLAGIGEEVGGVIVYAAVYTWAGFTVLMGALHASRAVAQERMAGTWDALIMSRLGGRGIVIGKLLATLLPLWVFGVLLLVCALPITLMGPDPLEMNLYLLIAYGTAVIAGTAAASLGLYCSMRCRTIMSAQFLTIVLGAAILMFAQCGGVVLIPLGLVGSLAASASLSRSILTPLYAVFQGALPLLPGFIMLWHLLARFDALDRQHRGT